MVYIITGPVGSGKSTRLLSLYKSIKCGEGFYNIRRYINNQCIGQDLIQMSTGKSMPFSRIRGYIPEDWDETACLYDYSFSKRGLTFAENIAESVLKSHMVAFIDELGPLELKGLGLFSCYKKLCAAKLDIYTVCRNYCVQPVLELFEIEDYEVI